MRPDMNKVIVERPRHGSRNPSRKKGYRKYLQNVGIDELPSREPMLGKWKGMDKDLNEHLGPMQRFLRSNVGRPWNHVYKDLCEYVSFDNAVQSHVLDHIFDFVHKHVEVRSNSEIFTFEPYWGYRTLHEGDMYICPKSQILKVVRKNRRQLEPTSLKSGPLRQFKRRDNNWWELRLNKIPDEPNDLWDIWLEKDVILVAKEVFKAEYGDQLFAISKRPLDSRETKHLYRHLRTKKRNKR